VNRFLQDSFDCRNEALHSTQGYASSGSLRMNTGPEQCLVRVDVADTDNHSGVHEVGLNRGSALATPGMHECAAKFGTQWLRPQAGE
jgi:hypothetical protein